MIGTRERVSSKKVCEHKARKNGRILLWSRREMNPIGRRTVVA